MKKSILTICSVAMVTIMALTLTSCESIEPSQVVGSWAFSYANSTENGTTTKFTKKEIEDLQPKTLEEEEKKERLMLIASMNYTLTSANGFNGYLPIITGEFKHVSGEYSISGTKVIMKDEFYETKWEPQYNKSDNTMYLTGKSNTGSVDYVFTRN